MHHVWWQVVGPHTIVAAGGTGAVGGRAPPCWPLCDVTGSRPCAGHLEGPSSPFIKLLDNIARGKTVLQVAETVVVLCLLHKRIFIFSFANRMEVA